MARGAHGAFVDGGYMYIFGGICVDEVQAPTCAPAPCKSCLRPAAAMRPVGACSFSPHQLPHKPFRLGCMVSSFCWQLLAWVALPMADMEGLCTLLPAPVLPLRLTRRPHARAAQGARHDAHHARQEQVDVPAARAGGPVALPPDRAHLGARIHLRQPARPAACLWYGPFCLRSMPSCFAARLMLLLSCLSETCCRRLACKAHLD